MAQIRGKADVKPNKEMIRHMVLNSLRGFNVKFKEEFGDLVLCSDAGDPWRREFFPNYKYSRKQARQDGPFDWDEIFNIITEIKNEVKDNFPYKVMYVENSEADDLIATIIKLQEEDKYLIISGDKDFIQLHNDRIRQYNPVLNKFVGKDENPIIYIREHILKGDRSDGIPNILSDDNVFIEGRRQTPLSKKKIEGWVNEVVPTFTDEQQKNYERNRQLIDLNYIPKEIEDNINREFNDVEVATRDKILGYFINKKLKTLIESIDEF